MAINNPYVPGDPYSYDLKWIIRQIKKLINSTENIDDRIQEYVDNYIDHLQIPTDYINVMEPRHGLTGVVGDGVTDDTDAFKTIISYCEVEKKPIYVPQFCNILITDDIKMIDMPNIIIQGTISGDPALMVQLSYDAQTTDALTWDIGTIDGPVLRIMGVKNGLTRIQKATEVELFADGSQPKYYSIAYSTFVLGNIQKLEFDSVSGGWINENVFINGRIKTFVMDGDYEHNNNIFYRPTFEAVDFDIIKGSSNYFYDVRLEGTNNIHFHEDATANVITRTWLSTTPTVQTDDTPYTDDNGTNVVVLTTSAYNNYELTVIDHDVNGVDMGQFRKTASGLYCPSWEYVAHSDLVPVEKGAYIYVDSDLANWRIGIELYDNNQNRITSQPATDPFYGGSMSWDNGDKTYWVASNSKNYGRGASRFKYGVDTGVYYVRFVVMSGSGDGDFNHLNIWMLTSKTIFDNARMHLTYKYNVAAAPPSSGDWEVGDIIYAKTPTAGGSIGWVCTAAGSPGTWKDFGSISA